MALIEQGKSAVGIRSDVNALNTFVRTIRGQIGLFGDSRGYNNHVAGTVFTAGVPSALQSPNDREDKSSKGFAAYLEMLSGGRIEFQRSNNWATSGETTAQMAVRLPAAVDAMVSGGCSSVIIIASTNDRGGLTYAQTIANLTAIEEAFLASNIRVIWLTEYPRGQSTVTSARLTGATLSDHLNVRNFLNGRHNGGTVFAVDPWPLLADPISTNGDLRLGLSSDGLHLDGPGSLSVARALLPVINQIYTPKNVLPVSNTDLSAGLSTNNPYGALNPNPMMDGTGGSVDASNSGSVATNWTNPASPTGATVALAKGTDTDGYPYQQFTLSGAGTTGNQFWELLRRDVAIGTNGLAIGSILEAFGELQNIQAASTGIKAVWLQIGANTNSARAPAPASTSTESLYPLESFSGAVVLPKIVVPSGTTSIRVSLFCLTQGSTAISAVLRLKRCGFRYRT